MTPQEMVLEGTLKPDGTLELEGKLSLPPGRVVVTVRAAAPVSASDEGWWPSLQRARAALEAAGYPFMNEQEMQAHLDWLREDDDRIERIYQQMQQEREKGEPT